MGIERKANREAPIMTPRSSLIPMPLIERFNIRWASQSLADTQRYRNRYDEAGVSLAALLGDLARERGKRR